MTTMLRQILIHARNSMSHSLRSGSGVAFIVLTILAGLALANLAFAPIELGFIELEQFRDNAAQGIGLVLSLATLQRTAPTRSRRRSPNPRILSTILSVCTSERSAGSAS